MAQYYQKYLKYKSKYIEFKYGQVGGAVDVFLNKLNEEEKYMVNAKLLTDREQIKSFKKYTPLIREAFISSGCQIDEIYKRYFDKDNEQSFIYKLLYHARKIVILVPKKGTFPIADLLELLYSDLFKANNIYIYKIDTDVPYLPRYIDKNRTHFGYIDADNTGTTKNTISAFLTSNGYKDISPEIYMTDIFSDIYSCVNKFEQANVILVRNMIFIYCYNKFDDRIQVIMEVVTPTPCKQSIYTNDKKYKYVFTKEFFEPTEIAMRTFLKGLKFIKSRKNKSGDIKYLARGTNKVLYTFVKNDGIINDRRELEFTERCTLSKNAVNRIMAYKGNNGCYTNNFLDNVFDQNNKEKMYIREFGLWYETPNIIMAPIPGAPFITDDMGNRLNSNSVDRLNLLQSILFKVYILPDNYELCKFFYDLWQYCENVSVSWENVVQQYENNRAALSELVKDPKFSNDMEKLNGIFGLEKDAKISNNDMSPRDMRIAYIKDNKMNMVVRTILCDILLGQQYRSLFHLTSENVPKLKDVEADIHRFFLEKFQVDKDTIKIVVADMDNNNCWISIVVSYRDIYKGEYKSLRIMQFLRTVDLHYVIDMLANGDNNGDTSILDGTTNRYLAQKKIDDFGIREYCHKNIFKEYTRTPIKLKWYDKLFEGDPPFPFLERVGDAYMFNSNWKINRIFPNRISESVLICGTNVCISFLVGPTTKYCIIEINPVTMAYMQTLKNDYQKDALLKFVNNRTFLEEFENDNALLKLFLQDNLLYEVSIKELPCFDCEGTSILPDPKKCDQNPKMTKIQYSTMRYARFRLVGDKSMAFAWHDCIRRNFNQVMSIIIYNIIHCFYNIMVKCADEEQKKEIYGKFNSFCKKILKYNKSKELAWILSTYDEANKGYENFINNTGSLFCSDKEPFIARDRDNKLAKYLVWYVCFDMYDINVLEEALKKFYNKLEIIKNNKDGDFDINEERINAEAVNDIYPNFLSKLWDTYLIDIFSLFNENGKFKTVKRKLDSFLASVYEHFGLSGVNFTYYHHRTAPWTCTLHLHIIGNEYDFTHSRITLWTTTMGKNWLMEGHNETNHPYNQLIEGNGGTLEHHINGFVQTVKKIMSMSADEKTIILNCPDRVAGMNPETRNKVCDVIDKYLTDVPWKASASNLVDCPFIDDYFRPDAPLSNGNLEHIVRTLKGILRNQI